MRVVPVPIVAFIETKIIRGRPYYYHVKMGRVNGQPRKVMTVYLGTGETLLSRLNERATPTAALRLKSYSLGKVAALLRTATQLKFTETVDHYCRKHSSGGSPLANTSSWRFSPAPMSLGAKLPRGAGSIATASSSSDGPRPTWSTPTISWGTFAAWRRFPSSGASRKPSLGPSFNTPSVPLRSSGTSPTTPTLVRRGRPSLDRVTPRTTATI